MIKLTITTEKTARIMRELESTISDLSTPLEKFGRYMVDQTEQQFEREVDPDGTSWAALAPSTLAEKRRLGLDNGILTRTGQMRRSVRFVVRVRDLEVLIDFPSQFHQQGTSKMPQRRILGMNRDRRRKLRDEIRIYVRNRQQRYRRRIRG